MICKQLNQLKSGSAVYLIVSSEAFEREQGADKIADGCEPQIFRGEQLAVSELLHTLNSFSLFGGSTVVIVHGVDKMKELDPLIDYAKNPNTQSVLILTAETIRADSRLYKAVNKSGVVFRAEKKKEWEKQKQLPAWVVDHTRSEGGKISLSAAQMLVKQVGTDQVLLAHELEKLILYVGDGGEITPQAIATLCSDDGTETIWQLSEAVFDHDPVRAVSIRRRLTEDGVAPQPILRQLRNQLQQNFQILILPADEAAHRFPQLRGWIFDKQLQSARKYGVRRFQQGLLKVDEIDFQLRNVQIDPEIALDRLIMELAS